MELLRELHFNFICYGCYNAFNGSKRVIKPTPKKTTSAPSIIKDTPNGSLSAIADESSTTISKDTTGSELMEFISNAMETIKLDAKEEMESIKILLNTFLEKNISSTDKLVTNEHLTSINTKTTAFLDKNFKEMVHLLKEKPANNVVNMAKRLQQSKQTTLQDQNEQDALIQIVTNTEVRTWDAIDVLISTLEEQTNLLNAIKGKNDTCTCSSTMDDSISTQNLQQQHRNLINTNDSNTLAPNHSELMRVQPGDKSAEPLDIIIDKLNEQCEKIEFIKDKISSVELVGRNVSNTDNRSKEAKTQKQNNNINNAEKSKRKKSEKRQKSNLSVAQPESNGSQNDKSPTQSHHEQMENDWHTVQQRKKPRSQRLPSATKAIFWSKLDAHYDTKKATKYIIEKGIANNEDFSLTLMTNSKVKGSTYVSFKIDIVASKYEDLLNSTKWPWRSYVRKFHNVKRNQVKTSHFF